jgi:Tfp pilus assembly protein PilV
VEVIVAIGVLMVVMTALLPQLVLSIQATGTARLATQAKGVAQGELEKMRNLPYHISPDAGDFRDRDLLDFYYRNVSASTAAVTCTTSGTYTIPATTWTGFVPATGARCDYEPPLGVAFYRRVSQVSAVTAGTDFTVVVNTRFLSGATPPQPVAPPTGYDSQSVTRSRPATTQIGANVTVLYRDRTAVRATSTYTQIADRPVATLRVRAEANVTAVEVGSETADNGPASLSAGLLNLAGSLTYASTVKANLAATSAGLAPGAQAAGASQSLAAPPASAAAVVNAGAGSLTGSGCDIACWGSTRLDVASVSAAGGLPLAGTQAAPMQTLVTDTGNHGISFGNSAPAQYLPDLKLTLPLLRLHPEAAAAPTGISPGCSPGGSGASAYVTAGGYLRTTAIADAVAPSTVESCVVARTSSISLFPTEFAPKGVVVVKLTQASAHCTVAGPAHTPSATFDYSAVVTYWDGSGYQTLPTVSPGMSTDPLDAVNLATTPVGGGRMLGDYIASWSALLSSETTKTQADGVAQVKLPGVITIASQPTRQGVAPDSDPTSVVSVAIGSLGCIAEDRR